MPTVTFTRHLQRYIPGLDRVDVEGRTVAEVVAALDTRFPGIARYVVDERGALRRHVNIFVGDEQVHDRERLSDPVGPTTTLHVLQALSGG